MKSITTNEGAVKFHLNGQLIRTVPKGSFTTQIDWKRESVVVSINGTTTYYDFPLGTTIDGISYDNLEDFADALSAFSRGGGDGDGVTQEGLDERAPVLGLNNFLVGGSAGNEGRRIVGTDLGVTQTSNNWYVAMWNPAEQEWGGTAQLVPPSPNTLVIRTSAGQGKFSPAINGDEAVVLSQLDSSLENKVDKESGKGLSEENFTTDEKLKLSGLESPKFKGQFLSFADLASADVGEVGGYAYVDGGVGGTVDLYIWDVVNSLWEVVAGEPTAETPASIKSKYESNPDTNAFTDDLKNKLEAFTANFTSALKTAYDNAVSWISANGVNILNHISNKGNPHEVTASQIGLGNVSNTSDANKPVSIATQTALDNKVNFPATNGHIPVRTSTGLQGSQPFTSAITGNTIMFRDSNGRSHVVTPTENTHIANKAYADRVWAPDYSNMETVNRITTSGATWTVPPGQYGFVKLFSRVYTSGILNFVIFRINEQEIDRIWQEAPNGASSTVRSGSRSGVFPVKPGDVIQVSGNLERSCYFIPGVWA